MCRLIESIRLTHKTLENLSYHEARMNRARAALFGCKNPLKLSLPLPPALDDGVYKCRVLYKEQIEQIEYHPYHPRIINTLKLIHCDIIDYAYKYENRETLNRLFAQRHECDDILIVKNLYVTDTSYSNIIFYDGQRWVTPSTPLLQGTQRQKLLDEKIIFEQEILVNDLRKFKYAKLINALIAFEAPLIPIHQIK
jgi:4-amino-4-deoxychorismate lyase